MWLSTVRRAEADVLEDQRMLSLAAAMDAIERARALDPHALSPVVLGIRVAGDLGETARERDLIREAFRLDEQMSLDREAGLTTNQRAEFESILKGVDEGVPERDSAP